MAFHLRVITVEVIPVPVFLLFLERFLLGDVDIRSKGAIVFLLLALVILSLAKFMILS